MTTQPNDLAAAFAELGNAFGDMLDGVTFTLAASGALSAALTEDDELLDSILSDLDPEQLLRIHTAAALLAERAGARHAALTTIPEETDQ